MFDFLNDFSHVHHAVKEQSVEQKIQEPLHNQEFKVTTEIKEKKPIHREIKHEVKKSKTFAQRVINDNPATLDAVTIASLRELLKDSEKKLIKSSGQDIEKLQTEREKRVYLREMSANEGQYLFGIDGIAKMQNYFLKEEIKNCSEDIIKGIVDDIFTSQLVPYAPKVNKQDALKALDKLRLIKSRQQQLQEKIGELGIQLRTSEMDIQQRMLEIVERDSYDEIKTKIAEQFVLKKQLEREDKNRRRQEAKAKQKQLQEREQKQKQQMIKLQQQRKHSQIQMSFLQKQRKKQQEQMHSRIERENFKKWLKEFKNQKPLFVQKQQQYQIKQKELKKQKFKLLQQKQSHYSPLDFESLELHADKYSQLRREHIECKQAELDLKKREQYLRKKQLSEKIYKGKFRYLVLQELVQEASKRQQKQAEKQQIIMKKKAYSLEVKQRYKPKIDVAKREEIQSIIEQHSGRKRKHRTAHRVAYSQQYSTIGSAYAAYSEPEVDPIKEGKKYHRLFKQYIREKIDRGQIKPKDVQLPKNIQQKPNYLKQLREKGHNSPLSHSESIQRQISKLKPNDDFTVLMLKAEDFDKKAKRLEIKLRNMEHKPQEQAKLQDQYLAAIKAKMTLINNIK